MESITKYLPPKRTIATLYYASMYSYVYVFLSI